MASLDEVINEVLDYLVILWNTLVFIGNFAGLASILIGLIYWFTEYDPRTGKKLVVGGIILLVILNVIVSNPPLIVQGKM